jgi:CSLREA domain-containing protein
LSSCLVNHNPENVFKLSVLKYVLLGHRFDGRLKQTSARCQWDAPAQPAKKHYATSILSHWHTDLTPNKEHHMPKITSPQRAHPRVIGVAFTTAITLSSLLACSAPTGSAPNELTVINVTSTIDSVDNNPGDKLCADVQNRCSLRAAIMEANTVTGVQTINVPTGTYTLTLAGAGERISKTGDLNLITDINLIGADAATTVIDGGGLDRVLEVSNPAITQPTVTLKNLTVRAGTANGDGGGLLTANGNIRLENVTFSSNSSTGDGGGLRSLYGSIGLKNVRFLNNTAAGSGGGFASDTDAATVSDSQFTANTARSNTGGGGGLYVGFATTVTNSSFNTNQASNGFGGGVLGHGRISIRTSSLTGNQAMNGGGAAIDYFSDLSIDSSSISANTATKGGGGVFIRSTSATLTNATVSGNQAGSFGGGLYLDSGASLTVAQSTLAGNTASGLRGLDLFAAIFTKGATVRGSILASGSSSSTCATDDSSGVGTQITSTGANVIADASCAFSGSNDVQSADAQLAALSPVSNQVFSVRIPASTSPAVNRVPASSCSSLDARGVTRPQGAACDSGAVERTTGDP